MGAAHRPQLDRQPTPRSALTGPVVSPSEASASHTADSDGERGREHGPRWAIFSGSELPGPARAIPAAGRRPDRTEPGLVEAVVGAVRKLCAAGPIALAVDDLYGADGSTLGIVDRLGPAVTALPVLVGHLAGPSRPPGWLACGPGDATRVGSRVAGGPFGPRPPAGSGRVGRRGTIHGRCRKPASSSPPVRPVPDGWRCRRVLWAGGPATRPPGGGSDVAARPGGLLPVTVSVAMSLPPEPLERTVPVHTWFGPRLVAVGVSSTFETPTLTPTLPTA